MIPEFHPVWPFFIAALLMPVTRGALRKAILLAAPIIGGLQFFGMELDVSRHMTLMGLELTPYRADSLSFIFGIAFHIGAFLSILFALKVRDTLQQVCGLLYVGSALGVVFAGDFLTLFIQWELLGLTSAGLIFAARTPEAVANGLRYLIYQVLSGVMLTAGALMLWLNTGDLSFEAMELGSAATWFVFLAFGIKAGFPLLHNWIPDSYPAGTPTGSVFLCIFTTKAAIYALARGFPGTELLIYIGATMAFFPIFYAIIENNLRRVLSYSIINQLGFMLVGVGIGTELALNGTAAHAFAHIIYKSLLFMSMGAVLQQAGTVSAVKLGGLYRRMPWTATFCIVGAASISAFPLLSGFVSKAMIMTALVQTDHVFIWLVMLFASAGVLEHAGIKIPYFGFFADSGQTRPESVKNAGEAPLNMLVAMGLGAFLCIAIGVWPQGLYALLPYGGDYWPYEMGHVVTQMQLLFFATLAIVWMHRSGRYPAEIPSTNLDADWVTRRLVPGFARRAHAWLAAVYERLGNSVWRAGSTLVMRSVDRGLGRAWSVSGMVLWALAVFTAVLIVGLRY